MGPSGGVHKPTKVAVPVVARGRAAFDSRKVGLAQQDRALPILSVVPVACFLLDRDMPPVEGGQAGLLAAFAGAEMIDERFHRDRAGCGLFAIRAEEIDDISSRVPAANVLGKCQRHLLSRALKPVLRIVDAT